MIQIDTELMSLLPDFYRGIKDYQVIMETEKAELDALALFINAVHDNFYIQTLDEGSIEAWERFLGISVESEDTIEFRRVRILNRMSLRPPFTLSFLYSRLDELIGVGAWNVFMDYANYTMYIESSAANQAYAIEVAYTINLIKPAHIVYVNEPYLTSDLLESETISATGQVFRYRLSSWALGEYPFLSPGESEVVKMATTPSIKPKLIENIADIVLDSAVSARLNGSIIISDITKTVLNGTVTITYNAYESDVETITKVELLDANSNVLTQSTVYIPVVESVLLKHVLLTKEGI